VIGMDFLAREKLSIMLYTDGPRFQLRVLGRQNIIGVAEKVITAP
jgi:hypothetical protein